jgi:RNA polymerase sigma-70 factor, ECF subfamily
MHSMPTIAEAQQETWSDEQVIDAVLQGSPALFELLVRRYNQRLYRVVRTMVRDDSEAEDVMQEAHVRAFQNLKSFERRAQYSTWLARIAINEALARIKQGRRFESVDFNESGEATMPSSFLSPEEATASAEARHLLEQGIVALPAIYRAVLMLRDVEEMSTAEAADVLDVSEEAVKVRLHRARALLRKELYARAGATSSMAFQFLGSSCNRITEAVMQRIAALEQ